MDPKERLRKDAAKFKEMLSVPRPGMSRAGRNAQTIEPAIFRKKGLDLSDLLYLDPRELSPNPLNEYPPLTAAEMEELSRDISEKGIIVPLISRLDGVLVCGHNRLAAALSLELERVPVQRILGELTPELEKDIMKSENDRRRGGRWTKEQKEEFIRKNFEEQIEKSKLGGDRRSADADQSSLNIGREIEKKSRGKIPSGTARRIVAKIKKERPKKIVALLSEKERKKGEKLALRLKTIREIKATLLRKLERATEEEKLVLKELKTIGQPELFGLE